MQISDAILGHDIMNVRAGGNDPCAGAQNGANAGYGCVPGGGFERDDRLAALRTRRPPGEVHLPSKAGAIRNEAGDIGSNPSLDFGWRLRREFEEWAIRLDYCIDLADMD